MTGEILANYFWAISFFVDRIFISIPSSGIEAKIHLK